MRTFDGWWEWSQASSSSFLLYPILSNFVWLLGNLEYSSLPGQTLCHLSDSAQTAPMSTQTISQWQSNHNFWCSALLSVTSLLAGKNSRHSSVTHEHTLLCLWWWLYLMAASSIVLINPPTECWMLLPSGASHKVPSKQEKTISCSTGESALFRIWHWNWSP